MKQNKPVNKKGNQEKATIAPKTVAAQNNNSFLSSFSLEDKIGLALLLCIILAIYTIRSKFLSIPFERDEGNYSYFGKLLLEGKIPYKDFFEQKFPGLFYFYGFIVGVFGDTVEGMHTGFMFVNIASTIFIYFASRNLFSPIAGVISAATFAFLSLDPFLSGFTVQSEHGVAFFISLGFLFYSLFFTRQKWYFNLLMGMSFGCAFLVKTHGMFLVGWGGLMVIIDFFFTKKKPFKELIIQVLIYSGGVLSFIAIAFFVIYLKGSLHEMIYWTFYIAGKYVGKMPLSQGIQYFKYSLDAITQNYMFFWVHSILAIGLCLFKAIDFRTKLFGITLLLCSFITIVPGYFFYGHYWIQMVPGIAILGGLTYHCVITILARSFKVNFAWVKYMYLSVFGVFVFSHVSAFKAYYLDPDYEQILRSVYGNNPFPEAMEIANYVNAHSKPEDGIVLIGSEPEIYFYTHKKCPSRFCYFTVLVDNVPEHHQWQREFTHDVEKAKPRYLVFFNHPLSLLVQPNTDSYIFDWLRPYVDSNYRIVGMVDMIEGQHSVYKWGDAINNYKPVSKMVIYIFERKILEPAQQKQ